MNERLGTEPAIRSGLDGFTGPVLYAEHHESHAADWHSGKCGRQTERATIAYSPGGFHELAA